MPELQKKRLSATYEVQIRVGSGWQVTHALEDREGAILEAVALIGAHNDTVPIRVLGELHDALTNTTHPRVIWSHKPTPKPSPAVLFEEGREARVKKAQEKGLIGRRETMWVVRLVVLAGFLLMAFYVGTHIDMYNVRH
ncbi:hypothetical protein [Aliidongia dinghuensis]|nr:hypothetical protein [Aliidongia dinghuensis]